MISLKPIMGFLDYPHGSEPFPKWLDRFCPDRRPTELWWGTEVLRVTDLKTTEELREKRSTSKDLHPLQLDDDQVLAASALVDAARNEYNAARLAVVSGAIFC